MNNFDNYPPLPAMQCDETTGHVSTYTAAHLREVQKKMADECLRIALFYKTGAEISKRIEERFGPFDE